MSPTCTSGSGRPTTRRTSTRSRSFRRGLRHPRRLLSRLQLLLRPLLRLRRPLQHRPPDRHRPRRRLRLRLRLRRPLPHRHLLRLRPLRPGPRLSSSLPRSRIPVLHRLLPPIRHLPLCRRRSLDRPPGSRSSRDPEPEPETGPPLVSARRRVDPPSGSEGAVTTAWRPRRRRTPAPRVALAPAPHDRCRFRSRSPRSGICGRGTARAGQLMAWPFRGRAACKSRVPGRRTRTRSAGSSSEPSTHLSRYCFSSPQALSSPRWRPLETSGSREDDSL